MHVQPNREERMSISMRWWLVAAALSMLGAPAVQAQQERPKWYAELGYTHLKWRGINDTGTPAVLSFSSGALTGTVGYRFTPYLAVEGLLGLGVTKEELSFSYEGVTTPAGVNGKVESLVGVFVKPSVALSERIELFGRVGWVHTEHGFSLPGFYASLNDDSLAYGIGMNFNHAPNAYIQLSAMKYFYNRGSAELGVARNKTRGFSLSYGRRF